MIKKNIKWWLSCHLNCCIALILGIININHSSTFFLTLIIFILFLILKKNKNLIVFLAYFTGIIVGYKDLKIINLQKKIITRKSSIEAQVTKKLVNKSIKVNIKNIKINEPISTNYLKDELYTARTGAKIGDYIRTSTSNYSSNINFIWQPFLNYKKNNKNHRNLISSHEIKTNYKIDLNESAQKISDSLCWGESCSKDIRELTNLENLGCQHLLARSGLHLLPITYLLLISKNRLWALFSIFILLYYSAISNCSYSFLRAIIISVIFLLNIFLSFKNRRQAIYYQALIIFLIIDTQALFSISFQLSFALVAGLYFLTA